MLYSIGNKQKLKKSPSFNFLSKNSEVLSPFPDYFPTRIFQLTEDGKKTICSEYCLSSAKPKNIDVSRSLEVFIAEFYKLDSKENAYANLAEAFMQVSLVEKWGLKIKLEKEEENRHWILFNSFIAYHDLKNTGKPVAITYGDKYVKSKPLNHGKFLARLDKKQGIKISYEVQGEQRELSFNAAFQYLENYLQENKKEEELYDSFAKLLEKSKESQRLGVRYRESYRIAHNIDHYEMVASFAKSAGITIECYKDHKKDHELHSDSAFKYLKMYVKREKKLVRHKKLYDKLLKDEKESKEKIELKFSESYISTCQLGHDRIVVSFDEDKGLLVECYDHGERKEQMQDRLAYSSLSNYLFYLQNKSIFSKIKESTRTTYWPMHCGAEHKIRADTRGYFVIVDENTLLVFLSMPNEDVRENLVFYPLSIFQVFERQNEMAFCRQYIVDMDKINKKIANSGQENKLIKNWPLFDFNDYILYSSGGRTFSNLVALYNAIVAECVAKNKLTIDLLDKELLGRHEILWKELNANDFSLRKVGFFSGSKIQNIKVVEEVKALGVEDSVEKPEKKKIKRSRSFYELPNTEIQAVRPRDDSVVEDKIVKIERKDTVEDFSRRWQRFNISAKSEKYEWYIKLTEEFREQKTLKYKQIKIMFDQTAGLLIECFEKNILPEMIVGEKALKFLESVLEYEKILKERKSAEAKENVQLSALSKPTPTNALRKDSSSLSDGSVGSERSISSNNNRDGELFGSCSPPGSFNV